MRITNTADHPQCAVVSYLVKVNSTDLCYAENLTAIRTADDPESTNGQFQKHCQLNRFTFHRTDTLSKPSVYFLCADIVLPGNQQHNGID